MGAERSSQVATAAGAVFLSYASQDADAARRICDALRAAGIEVWFDQSELRGGDAWDRRIREHIHDCRLFIPVISANSERRDEGYFRREWSLAADRTRDMAHNRAFLVPVVIDGTPERGASVPEKFHELQWTRLLDGEPSPAFVARIQKLLEPESSPTRAVPAPTASGLTTAQKGGASVPAARRSRSALWAISALLAAALTFFAVDKFWISARIIQPERVAQSSTQSTTAPIAEESIAVLPFADMSERHDQEYFADGIAESLIDTLVKLPHLKVIGRTSSFQFKGKNEDLRSIGRQLGADFLVEGSVRRAGARTRVTAQLDDARSGAHRWSETFDRDSTDTFALQDQISAAIARSLELATTPVMRGHIDAGAYEELLRGIAEYDRGAWESARAHFQQALAREPNLIEAAEGIASVGWAEVTTAGTGSLRGSWERLRDAAQAVLRIDSHSAIGHAALGAVHAGFEYDWSGAEAELQAALASPSPGADALTGIAWLANGLGHREKALDLLTTAESLDPLSPYVYINKGAIWFNSADYVRAEEPLRKALTVSPTVPDVHAMIAGIYVLQHRPEAALVELALEQIAGDREELYAVAYNQLGRKAESDKALDQLIKNPDAFPYDVAAAYAMRGEPDKAFHWLDRAYEVRSETLAMVVRSDPQLDGIRSDPRYPVFLRKMNLPE
jgi:TolB-like protein/Flp pilus assembly protein TadD